LASDEIGEQIQGILDKIMLSRESQGEIDQVYDDFCNLLLAEMDDKLFKIKRPET
jgi:hypothetical protein